MSCVWTSRLASDDPLALPDVREEGHMVEHGVTPAHVEEAQRIAERALHEYIVVGFNEPTKEEQADFLGAVSIEVARALAERDEDLRAFTKALTDIRGLLVVRPHRFADQTGKIHDVLDDVLARPGVARVREGRT